LERVGTTTTMRTLQVHAMACAGLNLISLGSTFAS
jgi:hypothetical protein